MAGNNDRKRVARESIAHRPCASWDFQASRNHPVGTYPAPRDLVFSHKNPPLEFRTPFKRNKAQFKINSVPPKKALHAFAKLYNRRAGRRAGVKGCNPGNALRRSSLIGEEYAIYPWPFLSFPPSDAQGAKCRWHKHIRNVSQPLHSPKPLFWPQPTSSQRPTPQPTASSKLRRRPPMPVTARREQQIL